jgi:hypothetical protein
MLQAILVGFAGLNITDEGLVEGEKRVPKQWKGVEVRVKSGK